MNLILASAGDFGNSNVLFVGVLALGSALLFGFLSPWRFLSVLCGVGCLLGSGVFYWSLSIARTEARTFTVSMVIFSLLAGIALIFIKKRSHNDHAAPREDV